MGNVSYGYFCGDPGKEVKSILCNIHYLALNPQYIQEQSETIKYDVVTL